MLCMADLRVSYLGLSLDNPVVVSSSSLTNTAEKVAACAKAGAGAVVLKSLFEEEIEAEIAETARDSVEHTEAADYIRELQTGAGLKRYADVIRGAKGAVSIPVIASINAVSSNWWEAHVPRLESAGADALELNISLMPYDYHKDDEEVAAFYVKTVEAVRKLVSIPIAVKIGHYFSSIPALVDKLKWAGADAVVLFNRFYRVDIDTDSLTLTSASPMSSPEEIALPIRWISLMYGREEVELAASSGIHDGKGVAKVLLAGAQVAQVCTTLYRNGLDRIGVIKGDLEVWMDAKGFASIDDMRGRLSRKMSDRPETYERLQYVKALVGWE